MFPLRNNTFGLKSEKKGEHPSRTAREGMMKFASGGLKLLPVTLVSLAGLAFVVVAFVGSMISPVGAATGSAKTCDRDCLLGMMTSYLNNMVTHRPEGLPIAGDIKVRENTLPIKFGDGVWKQVEAVKSRQLFADPSTGQVFFWGGVQVSGKSAAMSVRLKVDKRSITEVETVFNDGHAGPFDETLLLDPMFSMIPFCRRTGA